MSRVNMEIKVISWLWKTEMCVSEQTVLVAEPLVYREYEEMSEPVVE